MKRKTKPQRNRGIRSIVRKAVIGGVLLLAGWLTVCTASLVLFRWITPPVTAVQMQRRVESLWSGKRYNTRCEHVPLSRISAHLQHAVIAAEDGGFYDHSGIDWDELKKVWRERRRRNGEMRGGSTITQQLDKNLFLFTYRSYARKSAEFILAPVTEFLLPKERILELYLNVIEWGPGVYGAEAAAQYHYHTPASRLSREQAARLAALIPSPRNRRPQSMDRYPAQILRRMAGRGW